MELNHNGLTQDGWPTIVAPVSERQQHLGKLVCSIFLAGRHAWSASGWQNLYVFTHGLVCAAGEWTSVKEIAHALPSPIEGTRRQRRAAIETSFDAQRSDVTKDGSLPTADFVNQHPDARIIRWRSVEAARLRKGLVDSRLVLVLEGGEELRWVWTRGDGPGGRWTPNGPFSDVERALRKALGPRLSARG